MLLLSSLQKIINDVKDVPGFSLQLVLTETKLRKVNKPAEDVLKNRKEKERGPLLNLQAVI